MTFGVIMSTLEQTKSTTKSCLDCVSCYKWHNETTEELSKGLGLSKSWG